MDEKNAAIKEEIRSRLERHLAGKPFGFNPDPEIVESLLEAMAKRRQKFGDDYCPCRRVSGDREADARIVCPCAFHEAEIARDGYCHCRLLTRI